MKLYFEKTVNGQTYFVPATTPSGNLAAQANFIMAAVKPGNKFYAWDTVPPGRVVGCNFEMENTPVCPANLPDLVILLGNGMPYSPSEVLIYAT